MVRISFLYAGEPGGRFDFDYFKRVHAPMAFERFGHAMHNLTLERGVPGADGAPPPYLAICQVLTESAEGFFAAYAEHADAMWADIPNYTNITPVVQVAEIVIDRES